MKIKSIAAVGGLGLGMGFASFIGAAHRVGRPCGDYHIALIYAGDIICNVEERPVWNVRDESISPQCNIGVLVDGNQWKAR